MPSRVPFSAEGMDRPLGRSLLGWWTCRGLDHPPPPCTWGEFGWSSLRQKRSEGGPSGRTGATGLLGGGRREPASRCTTAPSRDWTGSGGKENGQADAGDGEGESAVAVGGRRSAQALRDMKFERCLRISRRSRSRLEEGRRSVSGGQCGGRRAGNRSAPEARCSERRRASVLAAELYS